MPDPIEQFKSWYSGPDGKARWIAESESVEGFLARAFAAGAAWQACQPAEVPLPVRMQISPEGLQQVERERFEARLRPSDPPGAVTRISDYTITNRDPAGDQPIEPEADRPGYAAQSDVTDQTMMWPRMIPAPPMPAGPAPFSFGKRGTPGVPPSSVPGRPQEDQDAAS